MSNLKQGDNMNKYVMPDDFISKWLEAVESGKTQRWIAKELGIGLPRVNQRALYLRRYGVELPYLQNGRAHRLNKVDRQQWNDRIHDFLADSGLEDNAYIEPEVET